MKGAWSILGVMLLATPALAAASSAQQGAELQKVKLDYARACAGHGKDINVSFTEADRTRDQIRTGKGTVVFYREGSPESLDWTANDTYVFSATTGRRLQFARTVLYAGQIFAYVKTIDGNGHSHDNVQALPDGWYLTDEPIFSMLKQVCHFRPVEAGRD